MTRPGPNTTGSTRLITFARARRRHAVPRLGGVASAAGLLAVLTLTPLAPAWAGPVSAPAAGTASTGNATAAAPTRVSAAAACSSTPFRSDPARHVWFRIPAIVATGTGALVAFAERRDTDSSDDGDFNVVTARSTDRGCTWSAATVIGDDAANRVDNPVPILDATTGDLLLFSVVTARAGGGGAGRGLYLQTSTDDGRSFSPLLSGPVRPAGTYHGGLTGPGHGVQLRVTHPGRLIVPLGYRTSAGRYGAYGIYSDDHGATWRTGFDQLDTTGDHDLMEGTIAERADGDLFISVRERRENAVAGTARQYAVSKDGGQSLAGPFRRLALPIVSVQGAALAPVGSHAGSLLFSAPADRTRNLRRDMSVFVSADGGTSWNRGYQVELESTPGSYSDLVQLDDATIGILYETGTVTWKQRIAFETIRIADLTHPVKVASRASVRRPAHPIRVGTRARVTVAVTVAGIASPPGRVTVRYRGAGRSGGVTVTLTYSNRGLRVITLPKLKAGSYRLSVTYSGTGRIAGTTRSAGTLKVVTR
jgi:sialidase-1